MSEEVGLPENPDVAELQRRLSGIIPVLQKTAHEAYGLSRFRSPTRRNNEAASRLYSGLSDFEGSCHKIPERHHLKLGLTPARWHEISGSSDLNPLMSIEETPEGPKYILDVGRKTNDDDAIGNKEVLNVVLMGTNSLDNPRAYLGLVIESPDLRSETGKKINPEDILSVRIASDSPQQV